MRHQENRTAIRPSDAPETQGDASVLGGSRDHGTLSEEDLARLPSLTVAQDRIIRYPAWYSWDEVTDALEAIWRCAAAIRAAKQAKSGGMFDAED